MARVMEGMGDPLPSPERDVPLSALARLSPSEYEGLSGSGGQGSYSQLHASSSRSSLPGILEEEDRAGVAINRGGGSSSSALDATWSGVSLGSRNSGGRPPSWSGIGSSSGADTSRCLRVATGTGLPVNEEVVRMMAEAYGEVASVTRTLSLDGAVIIAYYDSRAAVLAEHMMQGAEVGPGTALRVARLGGAEAAQVFPATGVLSVVSVGGPPLTLGELATLAGAYGEVAAINVDAARHNVARVEFCDVRCAAAAVQGLAARPPGADGRRLVVTEVSRTGQGSGKPPAHPSPPGSTTSGGTGLAAGSSSFGNIEEQLAALGLGGSLPSAAAAMAASSSDHPLVGSPPGAGTGPSKLGVGGFGSSAALLASLETAGQQAAVGASLPFSSSAPMLDALLQSDQASVVNLPPSMVTGGSNTAGSLGFGRSMSEVSLDGGIGAFGGLPTTTGNGMGNPGVAGLGLSMSTGDLLGLAGFGNGAGSAANSAVQAGLTASSSATLHGSASAGSLWPPPQQAGPQHAWPGNTTAPDVLALQQQTALTAALLQRQQQQQQALAQGAVMQAAIQQALLTQQLLGQPVSGSGNALVDQLGWGAAGGAAANGAASLLGVAGLLGGGAQSALGAQAAAPPTMSSGGSHHHHVPRSRSEAALGGRLARRPMEAGAEAERRAQQERLYALDLTRIESGEDKRTTLMVRNIPNKYTQKMLLSLIEERFKGEFDFFYLPIDFKNKCNVGYAFINMVRPNCIPALVAELHGKRWPKFNSEKVCCITYGRIQGKAALVQHFQNSSLLHEDKRCRPILFKTEGDRAGEPEMFPPES